ncbi:WXG100 family type VII secretion target [Pseudonocardia sp. GCM10023141]|uniref:WXG100 family type VII secretion target n=1 Tax=Pseudonocardia sp. GCM10023141 TaxID=3252653 RepID=UPI00361A2EB9
MARTRFDLAELQRCEVAADETVRHIDRQLGELRAALAPVRAQWTGDAAHAWDAHQRRWDAAAADIVARLGDLHRLLQVARANYTAALDANVRSWRP